MTNRTSFNLSSIGFAFVVLLSIFIGGVYREKSTGLTQQQSIEQTSVTATISDTMPIVRTTPALRVGVAMPSPLKKPVISTKNIALAPTVPKIEKNASLPPDIKSAVGYIANLSTSETLLSFNANRRWAMASLTKLMTAVIAKEMLGYSRVITMSADALSNEGNNWGFTVGEQFTSGDLIQAMLVVSHNQAAAMLAETFGKKEFVDAMQRRAYELGMHNTAFFDPIGFSSLNQSSATDIEKLVRYILTNHQDLLMMSRQPSVTINGKTLKNINLFAGQPDFIGGKTGYTEAASGNLASLFNYRNQPLLIIVMGTDDRFGETERLYSWAKGY